MESNSLHERKHRFCGHCYEYQTKTVFYKHKQMYYDRVTWDWSAQRVVHPVVIDDEEFDCDISETTSEDQCITIQADAECEFDQEDLVDHGINSSVDNDYVRLVDKCQTLWANIGVQCKL